MSILKPILIFVGAGTGGLLRYWIGGAMQNLTPSSFPLGTFVVNVSGCLAMGFLAGLWQVGQTPIRDEYRAMVLVGVLGGYTTFSSFGRETLTLIEERQWLSCSFYVLGTVALSFAATWAGATAATKMCGGGT